MQLNELIDEKIKNVVAITTPLGFLKFPSVTNNNNKFLGNNKILDTLKFV